MERRFGKVFFDGGFIIGGEGDPHSLCFHRHYIVVDDPLLDQTVYVRSVGGDKRSELIVHFELYGNLEFSHLAYLILTKHQLQCSQDPVLPGWRWIVRDS